MVQARLARNEVQFGGVTVSVSPSLPPPRTNLPLPPMSHQEVVLHGEERVA